MDPFTAIALGSIGGGLVNMFGASRASRRQRRAIREANALDEQRYAEFEEMMTPFLEQGADAWQQYTQMVLSGDMDYPDVPDYTGFEGDPGRDFRIRQGETAVNRNAARRGRAFSPATDKALMRFNQDYASNEFNNYAGREDRRFSNSMLLRDRQLNRIAGVADTGQNAALTLGTSRMGLSNRAVSAGNVSAAGTMAQTNAVNDSINSILNAYMFKKAGGFD